MTSAAKPWPHTVICDPETVVELLAMKSKEEDRALLNAVRKLGELRSLPSSGSAWRWHAWSPPG